MSFQESGGAPRLSMDLEGHVLYTCDRQVVVLFKEILAIFEQLGEEHDEAMGKLYDALPPDYQPYVALADHYTDDKFLRIRTAVLARGNDCRRMIGEELSKYHMTFASSPPIIDKNPSNTANL